MADIASRRKFRLSPSRYRSDGPRPNYEVERTVKAAMKTADEIRGLQEELEVAHDESYQLIDHFIKLYTGKVDLGFPEDKRYVAFDARSSKAADIIHRVQGMLMAPLKPHYIPPAGRIQSQEGAGNIEKHVEAAYQWFKRMYGPFDVQALFWQLLAGRSYIQQTYLPTYWDKDFYRKEDDESREAHQQRMQSYKGYMGPPYFVESLDPRIVYPVRRPWGVDAWVKKYEVQRFEAEMAFANAGKPIRIVDNRDGGVDVLEQTRGRPGQELPEQSGDTASKSVTYYEFIDEEFIYYLIEDRVQHVYRHDGGIKICPAGGLITGFKEFALATVSLLYPVRNEIPQLDFMRTLWVNRAYIDVFPQLFAELAGDEEPLRGPDGEPEAWEIEPMTIKHVRGRITNAFKDTQSGFDYRAVLEMLAGDIDMATISSLARGIAGAQQPGYAINQLQQAMRTAWKPIIESREDQWSNLFEHYLWSLKHNVNEPMSVFAETRSSDGARTGEYLTIKPDTIQDFYQIMAELDPDLPIDKQGNMQVWMAAGEKGWATDEEVSREGFGKNNWRERDRQIKRDMLRRQFVGPAMEDAIKLARVRLENKVIEEMGLGDLNPVFNVNLEQLRQPQQEGPGTPGPGPAEPPPATAGAQPNGSGPLAGAGIPPTEGANQARPFPGPRRGTP